MDSPQSVVSTFNGSSVFVEHEKQNNSEDFIGVLDVYIYQARDIHNICIYQKQDVYAKLCLTSDPENALSTQIINGGGQNPVFNENLRLKVRTIKCSVKCEIWMMSRVRNYMEDQLLGFALVPLAEILIKNGKLEKDFSLSSTDLFHSPAGFVQLALSYNGTSPEVIEIPTLPESLDTKAAESHPVEFEKIEFPDPKIMSEDHLMVTEYFSMPCSNLDSQSSDSLVSSDIRNHISPEVEVGIEESSPSEITNSNQYPKRASPPSSVSTIESPSELSGESKFQDYSSAPKECATGEDAESNTSKVKPFPVKIDFEQDQKVMQQEIVDMYMKSMQQFTDSLAKMKLPLDIENGPTSSASWSSDQKSETPKSTTTTTTGSRVFYGSRAFF